MKTLALSLLALLSFPTAHAGGRVTLDPIARVAYLQFKVVLYSDLTTSGMARVIQDYTNHAWSGLGLLDGDVAVPQSITHLGTRYRIEPHIEVVAMKNAPGEAAALANTDPTTNYFYVNYGPNGGGDVSYVPDLGTSCGYLEVNMQLDTLAHEMGHNLMMEHRGWTAARPPLMYASVNEACVLQDADVDQIHLPAPQANGTFVIGRVCTPAETLLGEPEHGTSWDYEYLTYPPAERLNVYPNPVTRGQPVKLLFPASASATGELEIADVQGRVIHRRSVTVRRGNNQITLDGIQLPAAGAYFLRLTYPGVDRQRVPTGKLIAL